MKPLLSLLMLVLLLGCGSDPVQKGDEAYQRGEYARAIAEYRKALQERGEDPAVQERLALAYCRLGQQYYQQRKVWRSFEANVKKGIKYLPENPSRATRQELSEIYFALGKAFQETPPENIHQKRAFFDKTVTYLKKSLAYNPENEQAREALAQFKEAQFAEMLEKGMHYFQLGKSNPQHYLLAEYYLAHALDFRPEDEQARRYLRLARQEALVVPDLDQELPLGITNQASKKGLDAFYVVALNHTDRSLALNPAQFVLLLENGTELKPEQEHPFARAFPAGTVAPGQEAEGVVVFRIPRGVRPVRLEYREGDTALGWKNLP